MTFSRIQPNSYCFQYIGTLLRKNHAKNEKQLSNSFWEIKILGEKLTTTEYYYYVDDDDDATIDNSAFEKLRCLSAVGAKIMLFGFISTLFITLYDYSSVREYGMEACIWWSQRTH